MLGKIDISKIVKDHFKTFRSVRTGRFNVQELFLYIVVPFLFSTYQVLLKCFTFNKDFVEILIASLSILTGFLFNLLAMVFGFMDKLKGNAMGSDLKTILVKEIHSNISFSILLAIICIVSLLLCSVDSQLIKILANLIAIFTVIAFFLSLLMVLKRIYIIMSKELE